MIMHFESRSTAFLLGFAAGLFILYSDQAVQGQFEHRIGAGSWVPILPSYDNLAVDRGEGGVSAAFSESTSSWGARLQYQGFYHFAPTRTMIETRLSIAGAVDQTERASFVSGSGEQFGLTTATGQLTPVGDMNAHFRGDTIYGDQYIGLRDRFDLSRDLGWLGLGGRNWGKVDIGCGFSHKSFRQNFALSVDANAASTQLETVEELDTDYVGGEVVATWTRRGFGRNWMLEASVGYFDLEIDYEGSTEIDGVDFGSLQLNRDRDAITAMIGLKTEACFCGMLLRPSYQLEYFSDVGQIERNIGGPSTLTTDDAWVLSSRWELWF